MRSASSELGADTRRCDGATCGPGSGLGLELQLTSRWLVWLGAITIALGSVFLVRYSIERGWLGPGIRVALGLALGLALMLGGEWLRRQPLQRAIAAVRADFVPPALTAAGLFAAFASVYAAYDLYHLLAPLVAFLGLALIAALGVALAPAARPVHSTPGHDRRLRHSRARRERRALGLGPVRLPARTGRRLARRGPLQNLGVGRVGRPRGPLAS